MKIIAFEVASKFAHFSRGETKGRFISTHYIPPPTAIQGLIAAILGLQRDSYYSLFYDSKMALILKKPVEKVSITVNHVSTRGLKPLKSFAKLNYNFANLISQRARENINTQATIEYLRDQEYQILIYAPQIQQRLIKALKERRFVYTPYLGLAHCLAGINYLGVMSARRKGGKAEIHSVIPRGKAEIDFSALSYRLAIETVFKYWREAPPGKGRSPETVQVFFNPQGITQGGTIPIIKGRYWLVDGLDEKIIFI